MPQATCHRPLATGHLPQATQRIKIKVTLSRSSLFFFLNRTALFLLLAFILVQQIVKPHLKFWAACIAGNDFPKSPPIFLS